MSTPLIEVRHLTVEFPVRGNWFKPREMFTAVDDVSFSLMPGEALGIVGESGSGKSTIASALLNLLKPTSGEVLLDGKPVSSIERAKLARTVQPVFQDPYSSLNPHRKVASIIAEPLNIHAIGTRSERARAVREMLEQVGLPMRLAERYPSELSGGQRQRVAIGRALMLRPQILVCDEPTSALDVSVQAQILKLLQDLREELNLTYVFISHNLAVVEEIAERVAVVQNGRIVEQGRSTEVFASPTHAYTQLLLASVLSPDPDQRAVVAKQDASAAIPP